jgi:enoyl-CoA hydratase/carnithine racemase
LEAFRAVDADPETRVIVFTGAGDRAFCAGADMDFFAEQISAGGGMERKGGAGGSSRAEALPLLMRSLSKPTIAAVNGYALGVGATMTLLCDIRVAVEEAKFGFIFGRMGVMAELGSTFLLPRIVGIARACELMFTAKMLPAAECERLGVVNHVVARAELFPRVLDLAQEMKRCAPLSLRQTRQALYQGMESTFETQLRRESQALDALYRTSDHAEAVQAFREKRDPRFQGR